MAATALLLVGLAGSVGLIAGCGGTSEPSAAKIVSRSAERTAAVETFHLIVNIENVAAGGSGVSLSFVDGDVAVPDKLYAKVTGSFQGVPLRSELIVAGGKYFLKNPFTGKWQTVDVRMTPVAFFDPTKGVLAVIGGAQDVARDGSEAVGGADSYRLKAKVRADALTPLLGNEAGAELLPVELWIGKSDLLLRRIRLSGPVSASEPKNAIRTVELSAFDQPVQISAPSVTP